MLASPWCEEEREAAARILPRVRRKLQGTPAPRRRDRFAEIEPLISQMQPNAGVLPLVFDADETIRADTNTEALARLKPVFSADGTVTAGNASQISDGAAAVLVADRAAAEAAGLPILAEVAPIPAAILMFGEPGAEILYPDPGFPIYRSMIEFTGARPVPIPVRELDDLVLEGRAVTGARGGDRPREERRAVEVVAHVIVDRGVTGIAFLGGIVTHQQPDPHCHGTGHQHRAFQGEWAVGYEKHLPCRQPASQLGEHQRQRQQTRQPGPRPLRCFRSPT